MEIHAIVAVDINNAIGKNGAMPWHLSSEFKHFKTTTMGHAMILGRTTYDGFKKPLPGRDHLVLSSKNVPQADRVFAFKTKSELLNFCDQKKYDKVFVCGGSSIYQLFEAEIDYWHISQIEMEVSGADAFFNSINYQQFKLAHQQNNQDETTKINWIYKYYKRIK